MSVLQSIHVHTPPLTSTSASDIDTLVLAPKHVTHTDFFEQFPDFLRQNAPPGAIEELVPVPSGSTPIIKLVYSSIDMDLAFVSLHRSSVPRDINVRDEALLRGLDDREARSFNGVRVAAEMLELIPQPKTFSYALRAIKLWAKRRAIDANIVGFPGGIAWAIMVARICQLYPNACGSLVVSRFFYIIKVWKWSVWKPLELRDRQSKPDGAYAQWNPHREKRDALHLMPVITPTYPCMCTTHAVNKSTLSVILRELERGDKIVNQIFKGEAQWKDLFVRHTFFSADYKYYLCIVCSSQTKDDNKIWSGLVKSKVRHLVIGIMNSPIDVVLAHPYTEGFERIHQCNTREQREQVLQGNLAYQVKGTTQTTDETNDIKHKAAADGLASDLDLPSTETGTEAERRPLIDDTTEETTIYTTTFYIGIEFAKGTKSVDLTAVADDFKWMCTAKTPGTAYDQNSMALRIAMVKKYASVDKRPLGETDATQCTITR